MKNRLKTPFLGVAYYPEDWDESFMEQDITKMKEAGIKVARIAEFAWSRMENTEGVFTFDWLHKIVDALADAGIATIMCTPTATPPVWLSRKHPDVLMESEGGKVQNHGGRRHCCSYNEHYREYSARIVEKMAQEFGDNENIIGWQIDNEIYTPGKGCFCAGCQAKFKAHLKEKFGSTKELNKRWNLTLFSQEYNDFDEIPAPRDAWINPHHQQEWMIFQQGGNIEFIGMQADILKKYVSVPIGTDMMPLNGESFSEMNKKLDVVQYNHYNTVDNLWHTAFWFDFIRTIKDRPFWNTETATCWNGGTSISQTVKPDGFCYANSWLPVAMGGEANMYWLWRTHWAGHELMHGSVLSASGRPMHIFGEVQRVAADFEKASDFISGTRVKTPIAIHYTSHAWNVFMFQKIYDNFDHNQSLRDSFYKPLADSCCRPDVIESDHSLDEYKLIFTPLVPSLEDKDLSERMRKWVENGGVWVVGPMTDIRTADGTRYKDRPFGMLEEFTGVRWAFSGPDLDRAVECETNDGKAFCGLNWFEFCESDGDTLARVSKAPHSALIGKSVFAKKKVGKGYVFVLGTIPSYETMKDIIIPEALDCAGVEYGGGEGNSFMVIDREGEGRKGKIIIEYAGVGGSYHMPYRAKDILSDKIVEGKIDIAPYEVLVLQKD